MIKFSHCASIILCLHLEAPLGLCDDSDLLIQFRKISAVHSVTSTPTKSKPKQIISHLLNWHNISKEDFAAAHPDLSDGIISEAKIEKRQLDFLQDLEVIQ